MIDYSAIYSGISGGSGAATGNAAQPEFRVKTGMFSSAPVQQGQAVESGQLGGAGYAAPSNAIAGSGYNAPPAMQNSQSGGGSVGGQLADSLKAIGDMIANYNMAGAYGQQEVASQAPQMAMKPALATFAIPSIGGARR